MSSKLVLLFFYENCFLVYKTVANKNPRLNLILKTFQEDRAGVCKEIRACRSKTNHALTWRRPPFRMCCEGCGAAKNGPPGPRLGIRAARRAV